MTIALTNGSHGYCRIRPLVPSLPGLKLIGFRKRVDLGVAKFGPVAEHDPEVRPLGGVCVGRQPVDQIAELAHSQAVHHLRHQRGVLTGDRKHLQFNLVGKIWIRHD